MSQRESMRHQLEVSHGAMVACLEGLSEDEVTRVPAAGLSPIIWQVGHIALLDAMLGQFAGGRFAAPQGFPELFGTGTGGPARYPGFGQVKEAFEGAHHALVQIAIESDYETPQDTPLKQFYGTVGEMLTFVCFHRGWHVGKATTLRALLGKARMFG